jgi:hypothetical protein
MALEAKIVRGWLGLTRRVQVYAVCTEHQVEVDDPYIGCGRCHPQATMLFEAPEVPDVEE